MRAKVSREISAGHKINAIKIYREATGAPLADAKRRGRLLVRAGPGAGRAGRRRLVDRGPAHRARPGPRISELVVAGRREDAMALYAEATGASSIEAQAIIRTWDTTQNY